MTQQRFLVLGCGNGWHADQLRAAAAVRGCELVFATYESLAASIGSQPGGTAILRCEAGPLDAFDGLLTRTMPAGSLEQITFRLSVLHDYLHLGRTMIHPPRALEIAIDKFATLAEVVRLGYRVPDTEVVQTRGEAIDAFHRLGSDCVVKPLFGGEGRGVMRIQDPELAWTTFSTLQQLGAVFYVQRFIPPGGCDTRVLVIGDRQFGVRRTSDSGFRTNVSGGGTSRAIEPSSTQAEAARRITQHLGLQFAAVDFLDTIDRGDTVVEVNAVPGWRAAQTVLPFNVAERVVDLLICQSSLSSGNDQHVRA